VVKRVVPVPKDFEEFVLRVEPGLRRSLFAVLGVDRGREATAEALAWAWEHWSQIDGMHNPTGFLFRVGQSRSRSRKVRPIFVRDDWNEPLVEPHLGIALAGLTDAQRTAVILVHGFGWTLREVAELNGIKVPSVQTHLERGMHKLRISLEVEERA
jgi:DNA-directed RNA polymerase specialized sigma24 family protein